MTDAWPLPTAFGAVTDAALAAFAAIDGLQVIDGPTPSPPKDDVLIVGGSADDQSAVGIITTPNRFAYGAATEEMDIVCALYSWSGSKGMKARRDRVIALLAGIRQVLVDDTTLGGACQFSRIGERVSWMERSDVSGTYVSVGFTIHYLASI